MSLVKWEQAQELRWLPKTLRDYARARDEGRGFEDGATRAMRQGADQIERQAKEIERLRRIEKAARESHGDGSSQPWCSLCAALKEEADDADA